MPILYLLLAHLIADFTLQPERLIDMKRSGWNGHLLHSVVHFSITVLLLAPYFFGEGDILALILGILVIAVTHVFVDIAKLRFEDKTGQYSVGFFVDQLAHLVVILAVGSYLYFSAGIKAEEGFLGVLYPYFAPFYTHIEIPLGICGLIIATKTYELMLYQIKLQSNPKAKFRPNWSGMMVRAVSWVVIYGVFLFFMLYAGASV